MAIGAEEKTEPPTPRRRREARAKGQVARSQDLAAAVMLLTGFLVLKLFGPGLWNSLLAITSTSLSYEAPMQMDGVLHLAGQSIVEVVKRLAPMLLVLFLAIWISLFVQIGWLFTWQPITPSLKKINPLTGLKRLFSVRSIMTALVNFGKLLSVGLFAYLMLAGAASAIIYSFTFHYHDVFQLGSAMIFELGMKLGAALLVLALLDFAWQRYRHQRDLRMTKEEVKDELRSMEGDPQVKRRRRQIQFQLSAQRLRKDVPAADVVVTNPTHVAVAIRYDSETMLAPKVVAKGADYLALQIRLIASASGVPIVERKPLARALYETVEVGQYVPERFYRAVAEILAYIYELAGRSPASSPQPIGAS